jgi:hypothetical protein
VPGKKDYPDYFKIITDPIDIVTIEKLASDSKFSTLVDFVRTFDAMFENAVTYNPPGSEVYEDALTMMKFLRNEVYSIDKSLRAALGTKQPAASLKVSVKRMTPSPGAGTLSPGAGEMKLSLKRKKVRDEDTASTKSGGSDGKRRRDDAVVIDMDEVPRYGYIFYRARRCVRPVFHPTALVGPAKFTFFAFQIRKARWDSFYVEVRVQHPKGC